MQILFKYCVIIFCVFSFCLNVLLLFQRNTDANTLIDITEQYDRKTKQLKICKVIVEHNYQLVNYHNILEKIKNRHLEISIFTTSNSAGKKIYIGVFNSIILNISTNNKVLSIEIPE